MSVSATTIRALSSPCVKRRLATQPFSLVPFLYQTSTIQGRSISFDSFPDYKGARPQQWRRKSPRLNSYDSIPFDEPIPFEDTKLEDGPEGLDPFDQRPNRPSDHVAYHQQRKSTITETEREMFQKLFNSIVLDPPAQPPSVDEEGDDRSVESVFGEVMASEEKRGRGAVAPVQKSKPETLRQLASAVARPMTKCKSEAGARKTEAHDDRINSLQVEQYEKVTGLMRAAKTDVELWNVLEKEVFSVIRDLDLDGTMAATAPKKTKKTKKAKTDQAAEATESPADGLSKQTRLAIIGPNYPSFIVVAVRQLRQEFPSSLLPLRIIPSIKSLGRGSYVLGASTVLYNEIIAFLWLSFMDLHTVEELLQDMDNGGIAFDINTLELLDSIQDEVEKAKDGTFGPTIAAVWAMDRITGGCRKLDTWRRIIKERMQADAIRKAATDLRMASVQRNKLAQDKANYEVAGLVNRER
ncbi:hypothetical protein K432DRAFT_381526 [Lepidopterella palustris CBS 459.81]|uniref:Mtf2-like C-terminal domain-containing protein n=1 Tax=Lepidopterella palustris CBS 459.81 TaxID=1314670 RepID=A0A8E2ECD1_9PEZI|nr:hypothetical protein K432DRAFT_381526 [Lepidopterella palustris CBS 459.81]